MIVYQTDASGYFVGEVAADESPLEPGVFLIPGGCVEQAPPDCPVTHRPRRFDGAWTVEVIPVPPPPPPDLPPTMAELFALAAERRRAVVNGGTAIATSGGTIPAWTDADSQGAITALVVAAQMIPDIATGWKGRDGRFYPVTAATIVDLALGMMAFVNQAFAAEAAVLTAIEAGTITTTAQIDAWEWPSNG